MKRISIILALFCSSVVLGQLPPTQPPPRTACSYSQIQKAGDAAVNNVAKQTYSNAVQFIAGSSGVSATVDPSTGLAAEIYYPFSLIDKSGKVIAQGSVTLNGKCDFVGAFSSTDVRTSPVR